MPGGSCAHAEVGDQVGAVIAVKARAAFGGGVQSHARPPTGGTDGADFFGLARPLEATEPAQLIAHDVTLDAQRRIGFHEGEIAASRAVDACDRTQRVDAVRRRVDDLDHLGVPVTALLLA